MWNDAVQLGLQNREIVELARRHCLQMKFVLVPDGGRGMAEAATGLPIDMRQIQCPVAHGNGMASNLKWIAGEFYRNHCVGCDQRRPTGDVPNLATWVEDIDMAAAAARVDEEKKLLQQHADWRTRADPRRSLSSSSGEAMAGILRDIDVLDSDPTAKATREERQAARGRIATLADRAPHLFSPEVVAAAVDLIVSHNRGDELLDGLRRLALQRPEFAAAVGGAAISRCGRGDRRGRDRALPT